MTCTAVWDNCDDLIGRWVISKICIAYIKHPSSLPWLKCHFANLGTLLTTVSWLFSVVCFNLWVYRVFPQWQQNAVHENESDPFAENQRGQEFIIINWIKKKKHGEEKEVGDSSLTEEYNCNVGVKSVNGYFSSSSFSSTCLLFYHFVIHFQLILALLSLSAFRFVSPSWVLCLTLIRNSPSNQLKLNCPSFA